MRKLGNSLISVDTSHLGERNSSIGFRETEAAWSQLRSRFQNEVGFFESVVNNEISNYEESYELSKKLKGRYENLLFLGIGGSALGPKSLLSAILPSSAFRNFHFVDNPDPRVWQEKQAELDPNKTLVCSVTKSGKTFETLALTLLAMEWMGKDRWKDQFVFITDPDKGELRELASQNGIPTLNIHPSLGGRFCIFSPVGLFPAGLAGLDVVGFLRGASAIRDYCETTAPSDNEIFRVAERYADPNFASAHALMAYSSKLSDFTDWWVQLWAESLGKDRKGYLPLRLIGATDQHSVLQFLRDGPGNTTTTFINVDGPEGFRIPQIGKGETTEMLAGKSLSQLLSIEASATARVLTEQKLPHMTIHISQMDAEALGSLYFYYLVLTSQTGALMGINPFDQPGVEEGKKYTRESLCST